MSQVIHNGPLSHTAIIVYNIYNIYTVNNICNDSKSYFLVWLNKINS